MLNIQKVILLLGDEHLSQFKAYLKNSGSALSMKLINCIEDAGWNQPDSDMLCQKIYNQTDEKTKRKFFQLAHHTFKLTSYLARNFPFYLVHNLAKIGQLVNSGQKDHADDIAQMLLDIAEKVEDWSTHLGVLKFLSHQSFIKENVRQTLQYHKQIEVVINSEKVANSLYTYLRDQMNFQEKQNMTNPATKSHVEVFRKYEGHTSFSIRLIARYGRLNTLNHLHESLFYTNEVYQDLIQLRKDLEKHSYVIIHFADEIPLKCDYMYLKMLLNKESEETVLKESMGLIKKWQHHQFWKGYINYPQIMSISIQASHYLTHYCHGYKDNWNDLIPDEVREKIEYLKSVCSEMLEKPKWESGYHVRYINLNNIYCSFLLLCGPEECKRAAQIMESLLINYQQISFQMLYDSIFATLIIAYFSIRDHNQVAECYKRYEKLTANQVRIEENDLTIKAFYYISQWVDTGRKQYIEKLKNTYDQTKNSESLNGTKKIIQDLALYFYVPIDLKKKTS